MRQCSNLLQTVYCSFTKHYYEYLRSWQGFVGCLLQLLPYLSMHSSVCVCTYVCNVMYVCTECSPAKLLSKLVNSGRGATLVGRVGRRRRCFIVHHENIELLGINVCYRQQQWILSRQWLYSQWLGLRSYRHVKTGTTTFRIKLLWSKQFISECAVASGVLLEFVALPDVTHYAAFQPEPFIWWADCMQSISLYFFFCLSVALFNYITKKLIPCLFKPVNRTSHNLVLNKGCSR
jgi:hypothetical protein